MKRYVFALAIAAIAIAPITTDAQKGWKYRADRSTDVKDPDAPGDIKIINVAQDRFFNTDLDKALKAKGIKTIIIVGWRITGSVTYTSVGAMDHGYTVVIPMDTTAAPSDFETTIGFYNVLNSGTRNLANKPLMPEAVTLSRTDLISFQ